MALNVKCPQCGSDRVQLSDVSSKHGCFWLLIFGLYFIIWRFMKSMIGLMVLVCWDWWMFIVKKAAGKGYIWKCNRWFSGKKKIYYCHNCGHNFKG